MDLYQFEACFNSPGSGLSKLMDDFLDALNGQWFHLSGNCGAGDGRRGKGFLFNDFNGRLSSPMVDLYGRNGPFRLHHASNSREALQESVIIYPCLMVRDNSFG